MVAGRLDEFACRKPGVLDLLGEMVEDVCCIAASESEWSDDSHGVMEGLDEYYCKPRGVVKYLLSRTPPK